jgi:uncharacterized protein
VSLCYVDTSALAKRYLHEPRSDDVEAYLGRQPSPLITALTTAEFRSLLARRRRDGEIQAEHEGQVFAAYLEDIRQGHLLERALSQEMMTGAVHVIGQLPAVAIRTLDAIHLASAQHLGAERLATADRRMREGARALGFEVDFFG